MSRKPMSRKRNLTNSWNRIPAILCLAALFAATGLQAATIVYDSYGPGMTITPIGDTGTFTIGPNGTTNYLGAPFSPSSSVDLTSLTGNWAAGLDSVFPLTTTSPITISLWSGTSSDPTTELESWSLTVDEMATNYTLTSTTNPELVSGKTYWVVADYTDGVDNNNFLGWGENSAATTLGLWQSNTSAPTLALVSFDNPQPALLVQGTSAVAPEPSTLLLLCAGCLCVWMKRRTA